MIVHDYGKHPHILSEKVYLINQQTCSISQQAIVCSKNRRVTNLQTSRMVEVLVCLAAHQATFCYISYRPLVDARVLILLSGLVVNHHQPSSTSINRH